MKLFKIALAAVALAAATSAAEAAPASRIAPASVEPQMQARAICHHYRWSSQRRCTSAETLRFVARPPLYYPSRYFADRPHYYYEQRRIFWQSVYDRNRFYGWPYRYW